ncbi:MAG TPA: acylphosphatase [Anaeromyxobacteraceae bacterium]|nr:acylphosphatase [Anaeromyxobacteraceae bacterium]
MPGLVRVRVVVAGRVQGVAFRASAVDEARRLGVRGRVRNLADGTVEAEAEGEQAAVEALVRWCGRGPPAASVERVQVEWQGHVGNLGPFTVWR